MILQDAEIGQVYNIIIGKNKIKIIKKMILVRQDNNGDYFFLDYNKGSTKFMYETGTKINPEKILNKYSDEFVKKYLDEKKKKNIRMIIKEIK